MKENTLIHKSQKNIAEKVIAELRNNRDKDVIYIRVYYNAGTGGAKENWGSSQKGICMRVDLILKSRKLLIRPMRNGKGRQIRKRHNHLFL